MGAPAGSREMCTWAWARMHSIFTILGSRIRIRIGRGHGDDGIPDHITEHPHHTNREAHSRSFRRAHVVFGHFGLSSIPYVTPCDASQRLAALPRSHSLGTLRSENAHRAVKFGVDSHIDIAAESILEVFRVERHTHMPTHLHTRCAHTRTPSPTRTHTLTGAAHPCTYGAIYPVAAPPNVRSSAQVHITFDFAQLVI